MIGDAARDVVVTGIGLLSSLGEGNAAHWARLTAADGPRPTLETERFAPFAIHPLAPVDYDRQIPKKGDQRQMEPWQRIGCYAAGLALDDAGISHQPELLSATHMIVAAGGGERDVAVDLSISQALARSTEPGPTLNARLAGDLRPTLFLAQLSNLLAGSISIVHGVSGSSRTFMGEEASGADAARIAWARLRAGQADLALVGGAFNAAREDMLMLHGAGAQLLRGAPVPVWDRLAQPGMVQGSLGAFVVLEAAEHAAARGATPLARLAAITSDMTHGQPGAAAASAQRQWESLATLRRKGTLGVLSGASGVAPSLAEEQEFLRHLAENAGPIALRGTTTLLGHGVEAQFPANLALAALALARRDFYPPFSAHEAPASGPVSQILVTGFGRRRGEALALLETLEGDRA